MDHISKPDWLKIKIRSNPIKSQVEKVLSSFSLHTVCEEAGCPNRMECFCQRTATFMILGRYCTRNCRFCNVNNGVPEPVDSEEPLRVAQAVQALNLRHAVITSVTRDDLSDGGAGHFAAVISQIRQLNPDVSIEILIPDFQGNPIALQKVIDAEPEILNHNIETVPRLYSTVRPQASYARSLDLLKKSKEYNHSIKTKSGIMVGFGEIKAEIISVFRDLRIANCDFLTIGQYLPPSVNHQPVVEYVHPDVFSEYREIALNMGFHNVKSGPFVRSSYHAEQTLLKA